MKILQKSCKSRAKAILFLAYVLRVALTNYVLKCTLCTLAIIMSSTKGFCCLFAIAFAVRNSVKKGLTRNFIIARVIR